MVGCLGEDSNGDSYFQSLSGEGIDCASVRRDAGAATGVAQVDGNNKRKRAIFTAPLITYEVLFFLQLVDV